MSTSPTSQTAGRTGSPSALSFTTSSLRWTTFTDSWHRFGGNFCNKTYGLKKTFSRPLTTQSWQRRTENRIMNSPSRLESKFQRQSSLFRFVYPKQFCKLDEQGKAWNIETTSQVSNDLNDQKISGYPRLHLRGRHGRDDQFWKARPQSGLCLRPGGLQGPQGQLSKRSCSFDISGVLRSQDYLFYQKAANKTCWSSVLAVSFSILCWLWISSRSPNVHRLC